MRSLASQDTNRASTNELGVNAGGGFPRVQTSQSGPRHPVEVGAHNSTCRGGKKPSWTIYYRPFRGYIYNSIYNQAEACLEDHPNSYVIDNHGDHKSSNWGCSLPNGLFVAKINGGDPNYLRVLG